jgi:ribosomal protein S18 acetylase RimI-like enzyme
LGYDVVIGVPEARPTDDSVIEYRSFHNSDPPQLVRLWETGGFGRGAAAGLTPDAFERLVFSQPFFDPDGLIVACDGPKIVGFVHAGFGVNVESTTLDRSSGVLCAVVVERAFRRQGIGRELVARAERYLAAAGATSITAGPAPPRDPFYIGLYGGSRISGFLESDPDPAQFFPAVGYAPLERHAVLQRSVDEPSTPMNFRLLSIRRKTELGVADEPQQSTWWWLTRFGRLDFLRFVLAPKDGGPAVAELTIVGLDLYLPKWQQRAVGVIDLFVPESERRKGYAQALLIEVCRRLRDELVTLLEAHVPERDTATLALFESAGFRRVDAGVVYGRVESPAVR